MCCINGASDRSIGLSQPNQGQQTAFDKTNFVAILALAATMLACLTVAAAVITNYQWLKTATACVVLTDILLWITFFVMQKCDECKEFNERFG